MAAIVEGLHTNVTSPASVFLSPRGPSVLLTGHAVEDEIEGFE